MADYIEVTAIRSNTDSLSERAVHNTLVNAVGHIATDGVIGMRSFVPKDTGELEAHVGKDGPHDHGVHIDAAVGVPDIFKLGDDPVSMKYPIFVDEGTGIYGEFNTPIYAKRSHYMKLPPKEGFSIYHHVVKGQRPQHYLAATYALMLSSTDINIIRFKQELRAKLVASKLV